MSSWALLASDSEKDDSDDDDVIESENEKEKEMEDEWTTVTTKRKQTIQRPKQVRPHKPKQSFSKQKQNSKPKPKPKARQSFPKRFSKPERIEERCTENHPECMASDNQICVIKIRKTIPCRNFLNNDCPYGEECYFKH